MTKDEALKLALAALNKLTDVFLDTEGNHGDDEQKALNQGNKTILAIKAALAQPEQEPVAWLEPEWGEKICPEVGYEVTMTDDHPRDLCWIPLYAHPPQNTNETDEEIKSKCPRTDSIWSLGWYEGYKACNKNTAQAYLKGFDEGCKSMTARNGDTTGRWSGKTENIGSLGMPVNVLVTPPKRQPLTHEQRLDLLTAFEEHKHEWNAESILIDMVEAAHGIGDKT